MPELATVKVQTLKLRYLLSSIGQEFRLAASIGMQMTAVVDDRPVSIATVRDWNSASGLLDWPTPDIWRAAFKIFNCLFASSHCK